MHPHIGLAMWALSNQFVFIFERLVSEALAETTMLQVISVIFHDKGRDQQARLP